MKPRADLTPYPILMAANDDYIGASFHAETSIQAISNKYAMNCEFTLDEPTIESLLVQNKVEFVTHIECPRTSFRTILRTKERFAQTHVPSDSVSGFLEICTYIICATPLEGFSSPRFHPDYTGITFDLERGSILGIAESCRVELEDDESDEDTASIVRIAKAQPTQIDDMAVNTDGDRIYITLTASTYDKYYRAGRGFLSEAVASTIVLPALMIALLRLKESYDPDILWARVLSDWLYAHGVSLDDLNLTSIEGQSILSVAQRILENPIGRALASIEEADTADAD